MSEEHHHPAGEGGEASPPEAEGRPLRQSWFYYVAGFFVVIAGICYVLSLSENLVSPPPPRTPAPNAAGK